MFGIAGRLVGTSHGHARAACPYWNDHACASSETPRHVFSRGEWHKKKYAEDPDYRESTLARQRRYRQAHKKERADRRRLRRQTDTDSRQRELARGREYSQKKRCESIYGISLEQYEAMVARQGGLCAICKEKPEKSLCVDHCHTSGRVRGLLCNNCNCMLGFAQNDPSRLDAGGDFLRAFRSEPPESTGLRRTQGCRPRGSLSPKRIESV
jgi:hypothetical protein